MTLAVFSAFGAMLLFGVAAVLQGLATARAADMTVLDPRLLLHLARQPLFLLSIGLNLLGFLLHVASLQELPLFLVQAIIAGSVAVTAVLSIRVFSTHLGLRQWGSVTLVVLGLALLGPTADSHSTPQIDTWTTVALLGAVLVASATAVAVRHVSGSTGAVLLGLLAGIGFGVVAVCARLLPDFGVEVLRAPAAYVLVLAGTAAYLIYSAAMQHGSVTVATAAMVVTQTVVPSVVGLALGDQVRSGLLPLAVLGFALALIGALGLGRFEPVAPVAAPGPPALPRH